MFNNSISRPQRAEQIQKALDALAVISCVTVPEAMDVFTAVIDTLCEYPKPCKKPQANTLDPKQPEVADLAAYLFVSMARSMAKLACIGYVPAPAAALIVDTNLSNALSALID